MESRGNISTWTELFLLSDNETECIVLLRQCLEDVLSSDKATPTCETDYSLGLISEKATKLCRSVKRTRGSEKGCEDNRFDKKIFSIEGVLIWL